ncbi:MAG: polyhydroxyalkanoate synthesis regulator DNA-binding domain-containing protein [Candidatus Binatia bacterium]
MSQATTPLRLIKRYGNRKLYDTSESRYITLDEIARLVRSGNDVKVIDNENGDDLTAITFAQIILEEEKRRSSVLSLGLLRELVQHGEDTLVQLRTQVEKGVEAIGTIGEKAGRRVQEMVAGTLGEREEGSGASESSSPADSNGGKGGFFDDLLAAPQRRLEALQRTIDERIRSSVGRITNHPVVQHEVQRIERSIKKLEERLARLRREDSDSPPGGNAIG